MQHSRHNSATVQQNSVQQLNKPSVLHR